MSFVYFGSFHISAEILEHLVRAGLVPAAIVCSPDRPAGRKKVLTPPAIKQLVAEKKWHIPLLQPENPNDVIDDLKKIGADFFVVMGYPHILPLHLISLPPLGTLGVHPSLLPKYRGASPMQSALLAGERETGVTIYQMDSKMDHGPLLATGTIAIADDETNESLGKKASRAAGELLAKTIPSFVAGALTPHEQDHSQATFTRKFTTDDARVDMEKDAPSEIYRKIQALNPEPGVWTMNFPGREGTRVKLLAAKCRDGALTITEILPEGKKPMTVSQRID